MIQDYKFQEVERALKDGVFFRIPPLLPFVTRTERFDLVGHFFNHVTRQGQETPLKNAIWLKNYLVAAPYNKSEDFDPKRLIKTVKLFLEQYKKYSGSKEYQECQTELLAYKLQIQSGALEEAINPGFRTFAEKSHLHHCLNTHNHQLLINEKQKIEILYQGTYISWEKVSGVAKNYLEELEKPQEPYTLSLYGHEGMELRNRCNWTKLKPFLKGDTSLFASHFIKTLPAFNEKNKGYAVEFCSSATERNARIFGGDHTWTRLYSFKRKDGKTFGKMYSVGFYRPHKRDCQHHLDQPFRMKQGHLNEDVSEVWGINDEVRTVAKEIPKEHYKLIKGKIEEDKQTNRLPFHPFAYNCDQYAIDLARLADIHLPTRRHFFELFVFSLSEERFKQSRKSVQIAAKVANFALQAFLILCTPLFNFLFWFGGSGFIDKKVTYPVKPVIHSFSDLFNPDKLYAASPWILGQVIKEEVDRWRASEIAKLDLTTEDGKNERDKILFSLPEKYLIKTG